MPDPHEILTQLLSPAQADSLDRVGAAVWGTAADALQTLLGSLPSFAEADGRLVMPD